MSKYRHPLGRVGTHLPGLATHFIKGHIPQAACGTYVPDEDRLTRKPQDVTCLRCLGNPAWKSAWLRLLKEEREP